MEDALRAEFLRICKFGDRSNTGFMTQTKFAKFIRDKGLMDANVNALEVDLIFTRYKPKSLGGMSSAKLAFPQFRQALADVAHLKYPDLADAEAETKLLETCLGDAPPPPAKKAPSKAPAKKKPAAAVKTAAEPKTGASFITPTLEVGGSRKMDDRRLAEHASKGYVGSYRPEDKHKATKKKAQDITARLTDPSKFTGAHKKRFGADGKGMGKGGRTDDGSTYTGYVGAYGGTDHGAGRDLDWRKV